MKRTIRILSLVLTGLLSAFVLTAGVMFYRVFMRLTPEGDFAAAFSSGTGMSSFAFFGWGAGIFLGLLILIGACELFLLLSRGYITAHTENGEVLLSDKAISAFIHDSVTQIAGVDGVEVSVSIFSDNEVGLKIWLDTTEKNDFVRFSERIQQRVLQDLEFNFGIDKIRYFKAFVETTDIDSTTSGQKVQYK